MHLFRRALVAGVAAFGAVVFLSVAPAPGAQSAARSVRDGVYTVEQANRGEPTFRNVCALCHPDPMWRSAWVGQSAGELYAFILKSMPDDNPGSMTGSEVVDVLAYILRSNGLPAGAVELPESVDELNQIRMDDPAQP
jgi:hypothetical protein